MAKYRIGIYPGDGIGVDVTAEAVRVLQSASQLDGQFSLDLVDWWIFVIDVAGGDDIPRKRGPGVVQADLLVINKTDLHPYVGVDLPRMVAEASAVRGGRPVQCTNCRADEGVDRVADALCAAVLRR